jgi:hypothetical protein
MAKQTFPGVKTGGSLFPKVVTTLLALALLAVVVKHPADAAEWAKDIAGGLGAIIDGIATFVRQLGA